MDNITYDVRIWKTEIYKGAKVSIHVPCLWAVWGDGGLPVRRSRLRCGRCVGVVAGGGFGDDLGLCPIRCRRRIRVMR